MNGGVLTAIGDTPLVELRRVVPAGSARVVAKVEWANPTGSMKDRMALAAIEAAERDGRLSPGGTVVEATMGTTGISLAFVCAAKGYELEIIYSDAFSREKRQTMEAFGARVIDLPSDGRKITAELVKRMIATADEKSRLPGCWYFDQLRNHDAIAGYFPLADELWEQSGGRVDAFVHSVSTAHSLHGVTESLRRHDSTIRAIAVEPAESAVLAGGASGAHQIEGIGIGFVPPLFRPDLVDGYAAVSTAEAKAMARRLAHEEGILTGASSGANVVAALRLAAELGPGATVATLLVDSGLRYLSTGLYDEA